MYSVAAFRAPSLPRMDSIKQEQIAWVRAVMAHLGVKSANALAILAGVNPANIQKPLKEETKAKFGVDTIAKIAAAANLRPMQFPHRPAGMAEVEASRFEFDQAADAIDSNVDRAVRELTRGRNGRDPWVIQTKALELSGILPGDIVIVDLNLQPKPLDVVCAQIYDTSGMKAETIFRIYQPPYLMTNSVLFGITKPLLVDGRDVVIRGVVDGMFRRRPAAVEAA